ncbi:Sip2p [Nakaseomyces bracarensis]|uniref:Sip2p n=1 Tax=Nakaseomyces bracarensis TaxID=273131 RepID=UPI003871DE1D
MGNTPSVVGFEEFQKRNKAQMQKDVKDIGDRVEKVELESEPRGERPIVRKKSTLLFDEESPNETESNTESDRRGSVCSTTSSSCSSHGSICEDHVCESTEHENMLEREENIRSYDEEVTTVTNSSVDLGKTKEHAEEEEQKQERERANAVVHAVPNENGMIPVEIKWEQGGEKVYLTGSFTNWRKMIGLIPVEGEPGHFRIKLQLPPGTHRFRFIVDNELRFSDHLPTATDQMGNFVNYLEVGVHTTDPSVVVSPKKSETKKEKPLNRERTSTRPLSARSCIALEIGKEPDDFGDGYTRYHEELPPQPKYDYTKEIPAIFVDHTIIEQLTMEKQRKKNNNMTWLTPPQLPPQLENVILNKIGEPLSQMNENNVGALPIPNHSVLNHLVTTSIKHNTLCVATNNRYRHKYVSQIYYVPL